MTTLSKREVVVRLKGCKDRTDVVISKEGRIVKDSALALFLQLLIMVYQ